MRSLLTFLFASLISFYANAQLSGLTYTTYASTGPTPNYNNLAYPNPLSTGTMTTINYDWGSGVVLNSGRSEQVMVHVTGYLTAPGTGNQTFTFYNRSDDGFVMKINNTTVINNWAEQGPANYNSSGAITLTGGEQYPIDVWYYENGGGAVMQLNWNYNSLQIVPAFASGITPEQQSRVNNNTTRLNGIIKNSIYIDQVGSSNTVNIQQNTRNNQVGGTTTTSAPIQGTLNNVTVRQGDTGTRLGNNLLDLSVTGSGSNTLNLNQGTDTNGNWTGLDIGKHYQLVSVAGYNNTVTTQQQNTGGAVGNYLEANVTGNYNTVSVTQTGGATQKQVFSTVNGNSNTLNATQTGTSGHYLNANLSGNGNSANVIQNNTGASGANYATISLVNGGGPASLNLTQTGGQVYNILSTCVTVGGCQTITVRQGN